MDRASSDLAAVLAHEFAVWYQNLGAQGVLPRAFTGVTKDGKQAIVTLTSLPLDHIQRRDFLIWLCRTEQFVAYAYGTHVMMASDSTSSLSEGVDIYASSDSYDVANILGIDRLTDDTFRIFERHQAIMSPRPENGVFFGLQRSPHNISNEKQEQFSKLWRDTRDKIMWWRQR